MTRLIKIKVSEFDIFASYVYIDGNSRSGYKPLWDGINARASQLEQPCDTATVGLWFHNGDRSMLNDSQFAAGHTIISESETL